MAVARGKREPGKTVFERSQVEPDPDPAWRTMDSADVKTGPNTLNGRTGEWGERTSQQRRDVKWEAEKERRTAEERARLDA